MIATIIFTVVAIFAGVNAHEDDPKGPKALPPAGSPMVKVSCDFFVRTERCIMNNMRKYDSVYDYEKDVRMDSRHRMMKTQVAGEPSTCTDKGDWFVTCPTTHHDWMMKCTDIDENSNKEMLKNCRSSCQECGQEAFLTTEKVYSHVPNPTPKCMEFQHHAPYHCIKLEKDEMQEPAHLVGLYSPSSCATADVNYCLEFDFRRRGDSQVRAEKLTTFKICQQTTAGHEDDLKHEDNPPMCPGSAQEYDDPDNCAYNVWFRTSYQFSKIAMNSADCQHDRRIILEINRGVDFFDIDNFKVYEGMCITDQGVPLSENVIHVDNAPK